jgi:hypothetical protein
MSRVSGKPVTYQPISLDKFTDRLHRRGYHDHLIQHLQAVAIDYRNEIFTATHDIVTTVDGAEPQQSNSSSCKTSDLSTSTRGEPSRPGADAAS